MDGIVTLVKLITSIIIVSSLLVPAVMGIELQIKLNNLTGLGNMSSVGQIVPLTIGSYGLFRAGVLVFLTVTGL